MLTGVLSNELVLVKQECVFIDRGIIMCNISSNSIYVFLKKTIDLVADGTWLSFLDVESIKYQVAHNFAAYLSFFFEMEVSPQPLHQAMHTALLLTIQSIK
jgi:hypothetical protein